MSSSQNLVVPEYIAKKLIEYGFNEKCIFYHRGTDISLFVFEFMNQNEMNKMDFYNDCVVAPLYQQVTDWFREKHNIEIAVQWFENGYIKAVAKQPFKANRYRINGHKDFKQIWCEAYEDALKLI